MKSRFIATVLWALACTACQPAGPPPEQSEPAAHEPASQPTAAGAVERGKYLAAISDCSACHTPFKLGPNGPEPDMTRYLSGHPESDKLPPPPGPTGPWNWHGAATNTAFAGPWGISYAINLTPDPTTGMGPWNEAVFVAAMRSGKHFGAPPRPIMPPMPWPAYAQMTDDDLKAVFAYLRSVPPIVNRVPPYQPPSAP